MLWQTTLFYQVSYWVYQPIHGYGFPSPYRFCIRFTGNAMYTFGFLILWVPGLVFYSKAALLAAGFHHIYIWVHYYTTELPDIRYIYGSHKN